MNNIIVWEDISIKTDHLTGLTIENEDDDLDEDEDQDGEQHPHELITSPFGVFHIKDFFNPMKQYRWQICHTNFNVSKTVLEVFKKLPGVERIVVVSRYRLLVAFGKAFNILHVKKAIYKELNASPPISEDALAKKKDLESIYTNWYIYYLDEKNWTSYAEDDDIELYKEKLEECRKKQIESGGIIVTNETDI